MLLIGMIDRLCVATDEVVDGEAKDAAGVVVTAPVDVVKLVMFVAVAVVDAVVVGEEQARAKSSLGPSSPC
jgi:hypothetical protein